MEDREIKAELANQIHIAMKHLGADDDLLSIFDRWGDTLDDRETLRLLTDYNFGAKPLRQPKSNPPG
jgi:hypothetical protein